VTGEVDENLFTYTPSKEAKEYKSLENYYESVAGVVGEHPMLGKPAPAFQAEMLDGKEIAAKEFAGKVVVLDFWATWCAPCIAAMPILKEVTDQYADKEVVFLAVNTGEQSKDIEEFLKAQKLDVNVVLDPDGKIADAFVTEALPQTVVIGKSGAIESVHVGFLGEDALKQRLKDELDVLCAGGRIGSVEAEATAEEATAENN
jgi:thiol-disulfide isomerase/thioredoxin